MTSSALLGLRWTAWRRSYLEQNAGALDVELTADDLAQVAEAIGRPAGDRYDEAGMQSLNA